MKKCTVRFSSAFLAMLVLLSYCLPVTYASNYQDVNDGDWRADAIEYVVDLGLMEGTGIGKFSPDQPLTRAQIVTILYRLAGNPETTYVEQFQDVAVDAWYASSVSWAYQQNIVYGTSEEAFSPAANITREQFAVIINNYIKTKKIELKMAENALYRVKDCWSVSPYVERGVMMVCETGLMNPDSQYNFNPKANVTRADAAVVFMRLSKALAGEQLTGMLVPGTAIDFSRLTLSRKEKEAQALAVAKQIAAVIPADRSDLDRVMVAAHIVSHYSKFCTYTMSGPDYSTAYGVFVKGEYSYSHQWCELNIDGRVVIADGQTGEVGYKTGDSVEYVNHPFVSFVDPWPYTFGDG